MYEKAAKLNAILYRRQEVSIGQARIRYQVGHVISLALSYLRLGFTNVAFYPIGIG